ncbi:MAG: pyridoxamine 5'-phosphate oxidase family protein [Chloroflexi bacterium]|nr:pyridoxamine 5'-phosphate oxidase family protein [Chloroflexota bacterium]
MTKQIPEQFLKWAFHERAALIRRQAQGEKVPPHEIFLGFTRHNPTIISNGSAGLNGSIKGVGFVPRAEYFDETLARYLEHINRGWREGYSQAGLQILMQTMYGDGCDQRIDFSVFGSLELAKKHTYANLHENNQITLLFYEPPATSFEVRGRVEIFEEGSTYHRYVNAQHDVYHKPNPARWANRPAYLFHIEEIFDNSSTEKGFGTLIF